MVELVERVSCARFWLMIRLVHDNESGRFYAVLSMLSLLLCKEIFNHYVWLKTTAA